MYTAIEMNRVKKSIQKATFIRKKAKSIQQIKKTSQKNRLYPKNPSKKGFVSMLKCAVS